MAQLKVEVRGDPKLGIFQFKIPEIKLDEFESQSNNSAPNALPVITVSQQIDQIDDFKRLLKKSHDKIAKYIIEHSATLDFKELIKL